MRAGAYAVASGACDVGMAVGAEKVKDSGYQGLNAASPPSHGTGTGTGRTLSQLDTGRTLALTQNLGGYRGEMVSFVSVAGGELG